MSVRFLGPEMLSHSAPDYAIKVYAVIVNIKPTSTETSVDMMLQLNTE